MPIRMLIGWTTSGHARRMDAVADIKGHVFYDP